VVSTARVRFTDRSAGDLAGPLSDPPLPGVPGPCTWLHQVHGARVVAVTGPGEHAGAPADGAVTAVPGCSLCVRTADCAPVAVLGAGAVGIAHAGWRGLRDGVVEAVVAGVRALGATGPLRAHVGPCIGAECYEFDGPGRDALAERYGPAVLASTASGTPAVDLRAAVRSALAAVGVEDVEVEAGCTACDDRWFSHRRRGERARQASFVWLEH
jgi:YfiH family protein